MAVNLMAIGLSATADDAEDVKLSLLRALRDQGFSREAAQKIGSTAIATGDRFLTEEWARYTTGATDLMVQKLGLAIDDVRAQQGRTGLQRLPPRQEEDEADRAARQLADIDLDELLSSDEDEGPAAATTPQLAPEGLHPVPHSPRQANLPVLHRNHCAPLPVVRRSSRHWRPVERAGRAWGWAQAER